MQKTAPNSQENTANLGTATAYAYKLSRTNPQFVALKLWAFGGISASENIDVEKIPERVAEIDAALCNGEFFASIRGVRFAASEKLLRGIRDELKTFIEQDGGSGAQVLCASHAGVEAPAASVTKCGQRQAPAPADLPGREVSPVSEMGNNNGRGDFASLRRAKSCATVHGAQNAVLTDSVIAQQSRKGEALPRLQSQTAAQGGTFNPPDKDKTGAAKSSPDEVPPRQVRPCSCAREQGADEPFVSPQEALNAAMEQLARNFARRLETLIRVFSSPE